MISTFSINGYTYYLTPTGKPQRQQFIMGLGWKKEVITPDLYIEMAKKYKQIFFN